MTCLAAKTYLTGGNGSRHADGGLRRPVRAASGPCLQTRPVPPSPASSGAGGSCLATGDAKYADHMERVLYNGFGSAIATEGQRFFYVNPLQRREDHFEKDDPRPAPRVV